jgi:hypothetical protein
MDVSLDCTLSDTWILHPVGCNSRNRMGGSRFHSKLKMTQLLEHESIVCRDPV